MVGFSRVNRISRVSSISSVRDRINVSVGLGLGVDSVVRESAGAASIKHDGQAGQAITHQSSLLAGRR